ncbi:MAG: pyridoxal phosphate-dependent aminotransferase [Planctomycetota bacterium]|nr:pyridoxal phosphate-dependent aminotransferase [Planctomycetota bacterium]
MNPSVIREILKVTEKPGIISFAGGLPSSKTFPVAEFEAACAKVLQDDPAGALQYAASEGYGPLRELVAQQLKAQSAAAGVTWNVDPAQILITTGSQQGLDLVAKILIDADSKVLVESPTYTPLLHQIKAAGGHVQSIPTWMNGRIRPESLRQAINKETALVVLSNLNKPTGTFVSPDELAEICDAAANHGAYVLVDEVYRDFIDSDRIAPVALCGPNGISTESLSKIHGLTQLKVGWLMGPPAIVKRASQIYDHLSVSIPFVCQEIARMVLEDHWDTLLDQARAFCAERLAIMNAFMATRKDLRWHAPPGGLIGLVEPLNMQAEALAKRMLDDHQTVVVPGRFFGVRNHLRVGFGGPGLEDLLERLGKALDGPGDPA